MTTAKVAPAWGLLEVAVVAGTYALALWLLAPRVAAGEPLAWLYWAAVIGSAALMVWISPLILHADPPALRGWGLRREREDPGAVRNAWPAYAVLTLAGAAAILAVTAARDPRFAASIRWTSLATKLAYYLVFAEIQALVFFGFLQTRLLTALDGVTGVRGLDRGLVALATASLFALAHWPNLPLAALAFPAGLAWSWLFQARPSVLLQGVSLAVLGTLLHSVAHLSLRIGPFYGHPEHHLMATVIPGLRAIEGSIY